MTARIYAPDATGRYALADLLRHAIRICDPPLVDAARRAMAGDVDALRYCESQVEMMALTGEHMKP